MKDLQPAMTFWTESMVKYSQKKFGPEYIADTIKFMTRGILASNPSAILNDPKTGGEYSMLMIILISFLISEKEEIVKLNQLDYLFKTSDGDSVMLRIRAKLRSLEKKEKVSEGNFTKLVVNKLNNIMKPDALKKVFNCQFCEWKEKTTYVFRVAHFKHSLFNLMSKKSFWVNGQSVKNLEDYIIAMGIAGKNAGSMYVHEDPSLAQETCEIQSITHPNFDFEKFLSVGPFSLSYGSREMMSEIEYVVRKKDEATRTPCSLRHNYFYHSMAYGEWPDNRRLVYLLAKVNKINIGRGSNDFYERLKKKIGNRLEYPTTAFLRAV